MKNIHDERPEGELTGRLLSSVHFVDDKDVKDKDVLDIGCGYGWCELNFLERGVKKITGIEISEMDLKTIRQNIYENRLELQVAGATHLPFHDSSFDTVVCWEVIEHIPKKTELKMFAEVNRVLRVGGVFYLSTPHASLVSTFLDPAWWVMGHRHYSRGMLRGYGRKNGLTVEKYQIKGRWWSICTLLNGYISKWIFRRTMIKSEFFLHKENSEYEEGTGFMNIFIKFRKDFIGPLSNQKVKPLSLIACMKKFLESLFSSAARLNNENIFNLFKKDPQAKFLDLGCDDGVLTLSLAEKIGTKNIYGVEIVPQRIKLAEEKGIKVSNFDLNGKFVLEDNSFDVIHANQVIEHLYDSDNFVSEIYRILKPGGYMVVSTENASSWCNIFASVMGWQIFSLTNISNKRKGIGNPWAIHKEEVQDLSSWNHIRIYNIRGLKELFEVFGFNVEEVRGAGYFPLPSSLGNLDTIHSHFITLKIRKQ